ncbi:hypothetical protein MRX96_022909 [Rhipicephalus microplus]
MSTPELKNIQTHHRRWIFFFAWASTYATHAYRGNEELSSFWLSRKRYTAPKRGGRALKPTALKGTPFLYGSSGSCNIRVPTTRPNKDLVPGSPPLNPRLLPAKGKARRPPLKRRGVEGPWLLTKLNTLHYTPTTSRSDLQALKPQRGPDHAGTRWRHARISDHIGGRKMKARSRPGTVRRRSLPFRESAVPGAKRARGELVRPRVT